MKTGKIVLAMAAVALLVAGCWRREVVDIMTSYPLTPENVALRARMQKCDAALVVSMADTQYVLLREKSAFSRRDGMQRCLATRYVMNGKPSDWSSRGGEFRLGGPEQPVTLTRGADNALTMVVDSIVIAIDDIVVADSAITFRIGVEEADRPAALYFYGKDGRPEDPFGETTIQQMIGLALALDGIMSECDANIDTGFAEADAALEEASLALAAADVDMGESADAIKAFDCYAEYSRIDSIAYALGFTEKETVAHGDSHLKYVASGGKGGAKACRERMESMAKAATGCHCRQYKIAHNGFTHRKCSFTIEW